MSWDVLLMKLPAGVTSLEELQDDFESKAGLRADLLKALSDLFPTIDVSDPSWVILEMPQYSIEFSLGDEEICDSIMLHVRGTESAIEPVAAFCRSVNLAAFDCSDGNLIDFDSDPAKGLRQWIDYRNKVAPGSPITGVSVSVDGNRRVFFDGIQQKQSEPRKPWWKFWV